MNLPLIDEIGKRFGDKDQNPHFCSVGDPHKLHVLVPLSSADYELVQENHLRLRNLRKNLK